MKEKLPNPLPLLPLLAISLLAALWAGLLRLGWTLPSIQPSLAGMHGPLMASGFLGTLIAIERVVALRQRWGLLVPALSGMGAFMLIVGLPLKVGAGFMALGSAGMVLISAVIIRRQRALYTWTMALGTLAWFGGNLLWLGGLPLFNVSYWWGGFLLLTIVGERLELSRVRQPPGWAQRMFGGLVALFCGGLLLSVSSYVWGMWVANTAVILLAIWLFIFDLARRNLRHSGLTRYIAANLLVGYGWLVVSGLLGLLYSPLTSGLYYDAWLHTLFLGFVFGMVFAHAPLIFPVVTGLAIPYRPRFYSAPLLLHFSLLLRLIADIAQLPVLRRWSGLINEIAILLFLAIMVHTAWKQAKEA